MSFSWAEWKIKLTESFPSKDDYAELLTEMLARRARFGESLELYFYDKINLLNRLEIKGKRAVNCLLHGLDDRSVRLGAKATKCTEPEQILKYFQSAGLPPRGLGKAKNSLDKGANFAAIKDGISNTNNEPKIAGSSSLTSVTCYNCGEQRHYSFKCTKKTKKCTACNKLGHLITECRILSTENKNEESKEKNVMLCKLEGTGNNKYMTTLKVNGKQVKGYIDLDSQCTLLNTVRQLS